MATRPRRMGVRRTGMVVKRRTVWREHRTREGPGKRKLRRPRRRMALLILGGMLRMGRRWTTAVQWGQGGGHGRRGMGVMGTPGERGVLGKGGRRLRGMLLILVIVGIEGMGLVWRRVDSKARLLGWRLGIVRRSPRHDGRVCRPRGGEVVLKTAASSQGWLGWDGGETIPHAAGAPATHGTVGVWRAS